MLTHTHILFKPTLNTRPTSKLFRTLGVIKPVEEDVTILPLTHSLSYTRSFSYTNAHTHTRKRYVCKRHEHENATFWTDRQSFDPSAKPTLGWFANECADYDDDDHDDDDDDDDDDASVSVRHSERIRLGNFFRP